MLGIGALVAGLKKGFDIGTDSVMAAAQIERYNVTLKTMLGSTDAARERMQEYFDIAKKTPFDMPQVVEAGNRLQALGKYSRENVTMLGDLAAASGKPMEQAVNAYSKLVTGEKGMAMNMFRDLLITTNDWVKATGKGVSKSGELLATTEELAAALPKIMKSKGYFGLMANQAATTEGKIANLDDSLFQLKVAVGERLKPAYDSFITGTTKIIESITKWVEIPIEQKIANEKAELNSLVGILMDTNTNESARKTVIEELQQKYPDFLKNIDIEKATTEDLRKELEKVNTEYDKKIRNAAIQRMISENEDDATDAMQSMLEYQASMNARRRMTELDKEMADIFRKLGFDSPDNIAWVRFDDEDYSKIKYKYYGGSVWHDATVPEDDVTKLRNIDVEARATKDLIKNPMFSSDSARYEANKKEWEREISVINTLKKILGIDEPEPVDTRNDGNNNNSSNNGSTNTDNLENSAETITGGGKGVKNFYINIENLLRENTNIFQSSKDDPASASDFMEKMKYALEDVVNDVNYAGA
jgi:hypothetical protein